MANIASFSIDRDLIEDLTVECHAIDSNCSEVIRILIKMFIDDKYKLKNSVVKKIKNMKKE